MNGISRECAVAEAMWGFLFVCFLFACLFAFWWGAGFEKKQERLEGFC